MNTLVARRAGAGPDSIPTPHDARARIARQEDDEPMAPRILIVDDDPAICAALRCLLDDEGYAVDCAASGESALAQCAAAPPDLVITNLGLPGMDGVRLAHELRAGGFAAPLPGLPFLAKPFELEDLLATVARLLAAPRVASARVAVA